MKLFQKEIPYLLIAALLIVTGLLFDNSLLAFAVCALLAVFAFLNPNLGLMILLIVVPLRTFFIALNPAYKVIGDIIIVALLFKTFYNYRHDVKSLFKFQVFEIAFFAFIGIGVISAFISETSPSVIAIIFQIRAYVLYYIVYYVVKRTNFEKVVIQKFAGITFVTAVIISLHGFVEKISDKTLLMPEAWTQWSLSVTNHVRVYGLLKGPNELALYLIIAFLISLYLLKFLSKKQSFLIYSGLSIIGTTFLLTYSRGAFLALGVFIVGYLLVYRSIKGFKPIIFTAVVSILLFIGVNYSADFYVNHLMNETDIHGEVVNNDSNNETNFGTDRFKEAFSEDTIGLSSADGRIYYVTKAIEVFKDYPVIGAGFATFGGAATLAYSSPIYEKYDIWSNFYSDNQYILTITETGTLGVLALIVFIIGLFLFTLKMHKQNEYAISLTLFFFFITMMVGGLVYNILEIDTFMMYYFLLLGFAYQRDLHHQTIK